MKKRVAGLCKNSLLFMAAVVSCAAFADTTASPRSAATKVVNVSASPRSNSSVGSSSGRVSRGSGVTSRTTADATTSGRTGATTVSRSAVRRDAANTSAVSRAAMLQQTVNRDAVTGRAGTVRQTVIPGSAAARSATNARAAASNVVRSGAHSAASSARAGVNRSVIGGASRASTARATAVFTDVSKIGGGYAQCREAYATCMDQFCANANDTYRRCVCSGRYNEFRDTESAIDQALGLLAQFENNNLTAVNLSAEEVNAMYSATEGEQAIKNDTSGAAELLSEISDLLSGNSRSSSSSTSSSGNSGTSLGILSVDFTSDMDDIWSNTGDSSLFDNQNSVDLSTLVGQDLYSEASRQCLELVEESCENDAVLTMARSAYSIMITQDCNLYEKNIDKQRESLENTIRTAEKYLREARLEEYRSHNSADVNECLGNVRTAILADVACGPNYEKCLDYSGAYFNSTTGEPIYSPRLFQANELILLPGITDNNTAGDIIGSNPEFNVFLDGKRMFAESALDTCRDISDIVWEEFKRQAIIEIAQAQDEKIEEVKMSCVDTMAQCYDTQTGALQDMDTTTAQYSGAISAYAARSMCADQVIACASLYGDTEGCEFDGNGRLTAGNSPNANDRCGLTELLKFVDSVDSVRIAEGCETAIDNYLTDLCTPETGEIGYPWNCRSMIRSDLEEAITTFAEQNCTIGGSAGDLDFDYTEMATTAMEDITEALQIQLDEQCTELGGYFLLPSEENLTGRQDAANLVAFYSNVYGGNVDNQSYGRCVENTTMIQCLAYNEDGKDDLATYDQVRDECTFSDKWYQDKCSLLGGYMDAGACYVPQDTD